MINSLMQQCHTGCNQKPFRNIHRYWCTQSIDVVPHTGLMMYVILLAHFGLLMMVCTEVIQMLLAKVGLFSSVAFIEE
jgi:hypothetical protein